MYDLARVGVRFEIAKDVAAFANHLGGTVLVGAIEDSVANCRYKGLPETEASKTKRAVEEAVRDRCSPHPVVDAAPIRLPGTDRYVLAVNVLPSLALVGVKVIAPPRGQCPAVETGEPAFVFPLRTTTQTVYLEPEQLPMYMSADLRRVVLLLGRIASEAKIVIHQAGPRDELGQTGHFGEVDEARNIFTYSVIHNTAGRVGPYNMPLDQVLTAHAGNPSGTWVIYMKPYGVIVP